MENPPPPNKIPAWQIEREWIVHRICLHVKARLEKKQRLGKVLRIFVRRWNDRPFESDPSRKLQLGKITLRRLYGLWLAGGQVSSALRLKYRPTRRRIAAPLLVRFLNFSADHDFRSFMAAHAAFCKIGGNYGPGRFAGQKLKFTYDSLRWNFPRGLFYELQGIRKNIRQAEQAIETLRARGIAEIRARVPAKLTLIQKGDFQI